jgi:hypothetical protein
MPSSTNASVLVTITFLVIALIFSSLSVALSDALAKPKQPGKVECGLADLNGKVRCCQKSDVNDQYSEEWCTICTKTPYDPAPHDCGPRYCTNCLRVNPPSGVVGGQQQPPLKTQQSPSFHPPPPPSTSTSHPSIRTQ